MQLSEHFSKEELIRSDVALRRGLDNTPSDRIVENLTVLCRVLLEPTRQLLEVPMHINSGYRSPGVNQVVGGAHTSAHLDGRAADFFPVGMNLDAAFDKIRKSSLQFDQVIIECNTWIHLGMAAEGAKPRREAMKATGRPGQWRYSLVID